MVHTVMITATKNMKRNNHVLYKCAICDTKATKNDMYYCKKCNFIACSKCSLIKILPSKTRFNCATLYNVPDHECEDYKV